MNAFNDYINGDSDYKPTQDALNYFIDYAYVIITNQVPFDFSVTSVKAIFDEDMFDVLQNIFDNYDGLTARQANNIEFLMEQYSNGQKIKALPGDTDEFFNDDKYSRWGRLELQDDGSYEIVLEESKRNYASINCQNIENIDCIGNVILDVVEQPRQFSRAYGCTDGLPYTIDDCTKEMNVNLQCVEPNGEWTSITNMDIDSSKGCTVSIDTDR